MNAPAQDLPILDALDAIERKREEIVRGQIAIAERLASLRAIVRDAADVLQHDRNAAADPAAPIAQTTERLLSRLSWQLHEERVHAEASQDYLARQLSLLAAEHVTRLAELTPSVAERVRQLLAAPVRRLVAILRAGRCSECSTEAVIERGSVVSCSKCHRFLHGGDVPVRH